MSEKIPNDWWFVGLPDDLGHWNIKPELKKYIERILGVYLFNRAEHTHCCELTPSHFLIDVEHDVHLTLDCPERLRDTIYDLVCGEPGEPQYVHVSCVNRAIRLHPEWAYNAGPDPEDTDPDEIENALIEQWHANPKF